jgi:NADH-quinone oxidoreductase subunit H
VRKVLYLLAPAIVLIPGIMNIAIIPFGSRLGEQPMVIADLNVGLLYSFGIVSLGVYGIVLAGYAANSKYPFLSGIRASAQMISYEIAMGMSVVPVFLLAGSLNLSEIISYQDGGFHHWLVFKQPLAFLYHLSPSPRWRRRTAHRSTSRKPSRNWPAATTSNTAP